jgi:ribosomal protein L4
MEHTVINQRGDTIETIELSDDVFSVPMNNTLIHQAVVIYQGNKRQGTHDTKTRAQSLIPLVYHHGLVDKRIIHWDTEDIIT